MMVTRDVSTDLNSQDLCTLLLRYFNNRHTKENQNAVAVTNKYAIFLAANKRSLNLGEVLS
jgi:hypothetical protein